MMRLTGEQDLATFRVLLSGSSQYQIRQAFYPGEITPEEANKLGYELAMQFTKGQHAFIVATHVDKAHVHNHIVFNSTTLDCTHKFNNCTAREESRKWQAVKQNIASLLGEAEKEKHHGLDR